MSRSMFRFDAGRLVTALVIISVFVLGGCSDGKVEVSPYAVEFAQAIGETDSDYVRSILEDGVVTAEEYRNSHQQTFSCLERAGIEAEYSDYDGFGVETLTTIGEKTQEDLNAYYDCVKEWSGSIDDLYSNQITNPAHEDLDVLIAACLVRKGIAPTGFTGKDYKTLMMENSVEMTFSPDDLSAGSSYAEVEIPQGEYTEVFVPGGGSLDDPAARLCSIFPLK